MRKIHIYDIEIYPNLFLVIFKDIYTNQFYIFEISQRRDNRTGLLEFIKEAEEMIGFNNLAFDYPILHHFVLLYKKQLTGKQLVTELFNKGQQLINSNNRWANIIRKPFVSQTDLFFINHYDNFAKATNLKVLEFNMEMPIIQELPFRFDSVLAPEEIDIVIEYCKNDVNATHKFFTHNIGAIEFRKRMSRLYNHDFTNYNDVKIGEQILLKEVSSGMKLETWDVKKMRTKREEMLMSDIIFDYVKFKTPQFKTLLDWWKEKTITETKGQFTKLPMDSVIPLMPYCNPKTEKGKLKNLNIILNNFQFDFGTGGLHGALRPGVWKSDEEHEIILIDVSSYYPNLAYNNNLHPEHIPMEIFRNVVGMLYKQRMDAKDKGDNDMVKAIKLALNGALYGKSNSEFSFMYDPQFMMSICVNGQLLLAMLAEQCILHGFELIQVNTDGVMIRMKKQYKKHLDNICNQWMKLTGLKLDYDYFDIVVQRDVNNYMAKYSNGNVKYKGAFDYEYARNGDWHKNFSMLIVPKALSAYFLYGEPIDEYIRRHINMFDFFKRTKYDKTTKLLQRTYSPDGEIENQVILQNVTRYYVSKSGYSFTKVMPPLKGKEIDREFAVESGYLCKALNNIDEDKLREMKDDINYDYYIMKTNDIIKLIENV